MECLHENAVYNVEFNRYSDENGVPRLFTADLTIYCRHCGAQFSFIEPSVSGDGLTLSTTIEPETGMPDIPRQTISDSLDLRDLFLGRQEEE